MVKNYHSNGKLLLTAEYLVLDGAKALALPCRYGQSLNVEILEDPEILWESYTDEGKLWFEAIFSVENGQIKNVPYVSNYQNNEVATNLEKIFQVILKLRPELFENQGFSFKSRLEFPQIWGLGSSSTLLNNLANWAGINAFDLSDQTFRGSGYDIACANHSSPILYQREAGKQPLIKQADFNPSFKEFLFFVHLGRKQNSREGIARYKTLNPGDKTNWVRHVSKLTDEILQSDDLFTFEKLIDEHERLISNVIEIHSIQNTLFIDYPRMMMSLGAWGGDFILATGGTEERNYFKDRGYTTLVRYEDMVL